VPGKIVPSLRHIRQLALRDIAMADNPSKYDQIRKLREARSLASEHLGAKENVKILDKKEIIVPKKVS
jgi:hypothetical protein